MEKADKGEQRYRKTPVCGKKTDREKSLAPPKDRKLFWQVINYKQQEEGEGNTHQPFLTWEGLTQNQLQFQEKQNEIYFYTVQNLWSCTVFRSLIFLVRGLHGCKVNVHGFTYVLDILKEVKSTEVS